jgi:hypothetical protein
MPPASSPPIVRSVIHWTRDGLQLHLISVTRHFLVMIAIKATTVPSRPIVIRAINRIIWQRQIRIMRHPEFQQAVRPVIPRIQAGNRPVLIMVHFHSLLGMQLLCVTIVIKATIVPHRPIVIHAISRIIRQRLIRIMQLQEFRQAVRTAIPLILAGSRPVLTMAHFHLHLVMQLLPVTIVIKEIIPQHQQIVFRVIRLIITKRPIQIIRLLAFQLYARYATPLIRDGRRQHIQRMIHSSFLSTPEGTRANGLSVPTVIPMHRIMHYLIAFIAIPMHIAEAIIPMHSAIAATPEEHQNNYNYEVSNAFHLY